MRFSKKRLILLVVILVKKVMVMIILALESRARFHNLNIDTHRLEFAIKVIILDGLFLFALRLKISVQ